VLLTQELGAQQDANASYEAASKEANAVTGTLTSRVDCIVIPSDPDAPSAGKTTCNVAV
jgi:hypothetical protein